MAPGQVAAQTDFFTLTQSGNSAVLPSEGAIGRADFDRPFELTGPQGGSVLTAPGEQAIVVAHEVVLAVVAEVVVVAVEWVRKYVQNVLSIFFDSNITLDGIPFGGIQYHFSSL